MAGHNLWRCYNPDCAEDEHGRLGYDFAAADPNKPACPKCQRTGATKVEQVCLVVLDPAGAIKSPHGNRRIACRPDLKKHVKHCTENTAAVTCQACQQSPDFAAIEEREQSGAGPQNLRVIESAMQQGTLPVRES